MPQTVLITGGSRGIGYATAEQFATRGWNVALCSRNGLQAIEAAERIAELTNNVNVMGVGADIGVRKDIARLFDDVMKRFPRLDALVNNAGILNKGGVFTLDEASLEEMMRINVGGVIHCSRYAFNLMKDYGGSIVNISSLAGITHTQKIPGLWGYTASKFAVVGLTEGLAVEGMEYGIRVNCVAPGATDTEMLRKAAPGFKARAIPSDVAKVVYYLCDKEQSGILSGSTIPVFSNS